MRELTINEVNFIAAAGDFSYAELGGPSRPARLVAR